MNVDPEKIEKMADYFYKPERGLVNYMDFVTHLDTMSFTRSIQNYEPLLQTGYDRTSVLTREEEEQLQPLIDKIRNDIKVFGIHLKPTFQDFDEINEEHVILYINIDFIISV